MFSLSDINMGNTLVKSAVVDFGIQWGLAVVAIALKTEKFFDLAGSCTFILLAYLSLKWGGRYFQRQSVNSHLVMLWAFRLGLYLFTRVLKEGEDKRFKHIRGNIPRFLLTWTLQGMWVFLNMLPTLIVNSKRTDVPVGNRDYIGWALWGIGFLFETVADWQKSNFKANPDNAGKFITSGLWSTCRHPNYFGEIMLWTGLYVSSTSVLRGMEHLGVISPLFTTLLLTKVSGIPMLERMGMKRWGKDPNYLQYVRNTAMLIPYIY